MAYDNTQIGSDGKRRQIETDGKEPEYEVITDDRDPVEEIHEREAAKREAAQGTGQDPAEPNPLLAARVEADEAASKEADEAQPDVTAAEEEGDDEDAEESDEKDEFPKHVGGGVYELRSGDRVKGKDDALEAQIEEDEASK